MKGITELSGRLLLKVKNEESVHEEQKELASYSLDNLQQELSSENALKTFWINIYNAYYQILAMNHNKSQGSIYNRIDIKIAGESFSLDDIEHGILRRYRWKWSKGYLPQIFYTSNYSQTRCS